MCTSFSSSIVATHIFTQFVASMPWIEGPFWVLKFMQLLAWAIVWSLAKSCVLLVICVCIWNRWPWRPPRQYSTGTCPIAASSGFYWSPGCALLGNVPRIVPLHPHGHQNHQQFACIFCCHRFHCWPQPKVKTTLWSIVVSRLVMYRTKVLMYRTMVLLACPTKVRR